MTPTSTIDSAFPMKRIPNAQSSHVRYAHALRASYAILSHTGSNPKKGAAWISKLILQDGPYAANRPLDAGYLHSCPSIHAECWMGQACYSGVYLNDTLILAR